MSVDVKHERALSPNDRRTPTPADFAKAKAGYASGYGVEHIVVGAWLLTWGQPGRKDFVEWLNDQDG